MVKIYLRAWRDKLCPDITKFQWWLRDKVNIILLLLANVLSHLCSTFLRHEQGNTRKWLKAVKGKICSFYLIHYEHPYMFCSENTHAKSLNYFNKTAFPLPPKIAQLSPQASSNLAVTYISHEASHQLAHPSAIQVRVCILEMVWAVMFVFILLLAGR
jgi:hypothetical protein